MNALLAALLAGVGGFVIGAAAAHLLTDRKCKTAINEVQSAYARAEQRNMALTQDLATERARAQKAEAELAAARQPSSGSAASPDKPHDFA